MVLRQAPQVKKKKKWAGEQTHLIENNGNDGTQGGQRENRNWLAAQLDDQERVIAASRKNQGKSGRSKFTQATHLPFLPC